MMFSHKKAQKGTKKEYILLCIFVFIVANEYMKYSILNSFF